MSDIKQEGWAVINADLLKTLRMAAGLKCWSDNPDFVVNDWSGGNEDDAYAGGYSDGETMLARYVLTKLGETW